MSNKGITNQKAWDLSSEYESIDAATFKNDVLKCKENLDSIEKLNKGLDSFKEKLELLEEEDKILGYLKKIYILAEETHVLLNNLLVYLNCEFSVDTSHDDVRSLLVNMETLYSDFNASLVVYHQILMVSSQGFIEKFLSYENTKDERFSIEHLRTQKDNILSEKREEDLLKMKKHGLSAWGNIYDSISGKLKCSLNFDGDTQELGISEAIELLSSHDREKRKGVYKAINSAWKRYEDVCESALNALSGWRLDEYKMRSYKKEKHYLDEACYENRMTRKTLDKMLERVNAHKSLGKRALTIKAKLLNLNKLSPWDLYAQAPKDIVKKERTFTFEESLELVSDAFSKLHSDYGDFVKLAKERQWIEARTLPNKLPGAYCTEFSKSRTPRVFMTFSGSPTNLITLSHELGHAFHSYVMRDLSRAHLHYPMNLAETASIFSENLLVEALLERETSPHELLPILWEDLEGIAAYLLNIPARFYFENKVYERRQDTVLTSNDYSHLMEQAWRESYGESLSEYDSHFWMSKLHFYMTDISFYNFPYTFGYLFSLALHGFRKSYDNKEEFFSKYKDVLRDTGRMTTEDLILKHFNMDTQKDEFWDLGLKVVEKKLETFEKLYSSF